MDVEKSPGLAESISLSQTAVQEFSFLAGHGFTLFKETLPQSSSSRDGFIFNYQSPEMSVDVEYYDMEFVVTFDHKGIRVSYLLIDTYLFGNRSGYQGGMFPREKLEKVILETAKDIRENYQPILRGDELIWKKIGAILNAPTEKRRLPS